MENKTWRYDIKKLAEELEFEIEDISVLFSKFFIEMKDNISSMKNHLSKKDWNMLERVVHNIKGVSINLNIMDVYEEAAEFDVLLKSNSTEDADIHVNKLVELLNDSEIEIRRIFSEMNIPL